jgi:hypothetical protein
VKVAPIWARRADDTTPADIILCWKDAVAASALAISQTQKNKTF